jgi:hypothetical protein
VLLCVCGVINIASWIVGADNGLGYCRETMH